MHSLNPVCTCNIEEFREMVLYNPLLRTEFLCRLSELSRFLLGFSTFLLTTHLKFFFHRISFLYKYVCVLDPPLELIRKFHFFEQGFFFQQVFQDLQGFLSPTFAFLIWRCDRCFQGTFSQINFYNFSGEALSLPTAFVYFAVVKLLVPTVVGNRIRCLSQQRTVCSTNSWIAFKSTSTESSWDNPSNSTPVQIFDNGPIADRFRLF